MRQRGDREGRGRGDSLGESEGGGPAVDLAGMTGR